MVVREESSRLLYSWLMGVEQLEVRVRCGTAAFSGASYIHCSSGRQDGGVGARVLWLCVLLSERPDSLAVAVMTRPPSCAVCVGVEVARAGQVELWVKAVGLDNAESVLIEEARLSGRAVA